MENINKLILSASLAIILTPTLSWSAITAVPPTDIVITDPAGVVVDEKKMATQATGPSVTPESIQPKFNVSITNDTQSEINLILNTCKTGGICQREKGTAADLQSAPGTLVRREGATLKAHTDLKRGTTLSYLVPFNDKTYQIAGRINGEEFKCPLITGAEALKGDLKYTFKKKRNLSLNPNKLQLKKKITCLKTS